MNEKHPRRPIIVIIILSFILFFLVIGIYSRVTNKKYLLERKSLLGSKQLIIMSLLEETMVVSSKIEIDLFKEILSESESLDMDGHAGTYYVSFFILYSPESDLKCELTLDPDLNYIYLYWLLKEKRMNKTVYHDPNNIKINKIMKNYHDLIVVSNFD